MAKHAIRLSELAMPVVLVLSFALPSAGARAANATPEGGALPTASNVDAETFRVEMTTGTPSKSGAVGTVKITLTAKAGFHINGQYPYRFKASAPAEGVTYPKPVLERADGQFEEKTAVFTLPFVGAHAGKFNVGGVLNLSVCSPANCIVQKAPLEAAVTVL